MQLVTCRKEDPFCVLLLAIFHAQSIQSHLKYKITHKLVSKRIIREKSIMSKNWIIKLNEDLPFKLHVWPLPRSSQSMQLLIGHSCVNIRKSKWWSWDFRVFVGDEFVIFSVCFSCTSRWSSCACDKVLAMRNNTDRILEISPGNIILNYWQDLVKVLVY